MYLTVHNGSVNFKISESISINSYYINGGKFEFNRNMFQL